MVSYKELVEVVNTLNDLSITRLIDVNNVVVEKLYTIHESIEKISLEYINNKLENEITKRLFLKGER